MIVYLACHGVSFHSLLLIILSLKIPNGVEKHIQELVILLCHVAYFSINMSVKYSTSDSCEPRQSFRVCVVGQELVTLLQIIG